MSISSRAQARSKSFCELPNSFPRKTRTTLCLIDNERSGIALFRSIVIVRPNPRHSGQAPSGLLKLKRPGVGGRISRSQCAQCQPVEKGIPDCRLRTAEPVVAAAAEIGGDTPASAAVGMTLILPLPNRRAV